MRKTIVVIAPVLAILAACSSSSTKAATPSTPATEAPSAATAAPSDSAAPAASVAGKVINVVEQQTKDSYLPAGGGPAEAHGIQGPPKGGDILTYDATLSTNGSQVGTDEVTFAFGSDGTVQIEAHLTLADGTLIARGIVPFSQQLTVPIVSGTGSYASATGTVKAVGVDETKTNLTITTS